MSAGSQKPLAVICSREGTILQVAPGDPAIPSGRDIRSLFHPSSSAKVDELLKQVAAVRVVTGWEMDREAAGRALPCCVSAIDLDGIICVGITVPEASNISTSQDHALYNELTRLASELASAQRTLLKQNNELTRLNHEKSRFLGMAAHDLRTPLGIIRTYSEFVQQDAGPALIAEHRNFLTIIQRSSEFMLRLIDDLLDITAIESGQLHLDRRPADLGDLVAYTVSLNTVIAQAKGIALDVRRDTARLPVDADHDKLVQVVNNLLSNGIKYSPPGSVITVNVDRDAATAKVTVRDQGPGISPEEQARLFQPFQRGAARTTAGEGSTGLGLAIVKRVIEAHGGQAGLESTLGEGSQFWFTLPLGE